MINNVHSAMRGGLGLKWIELFAGVDSGRRLIAHHYPEVFTANEEDRLPVLAKLAVEAMARQESNCARNGILLMSDMLRYVRGVTGTTGVSIKEQVDSAFHNGVVYPLDLPHGDD